MAEHVCLYAVVSGADGPVRGTGAWGEKLRRIRVAGLDLVIGETARAPRPTIVALERYDAVMRRLSVGPGDLVLVYDDLDLPLGTVRVRMKGSHGGHNGVRSIIDALGTSDIRRVKVGIGRPDHKDEVADHVLEAFAPEELATVETVTEEAASPSRTRPPIQSVTFRPPTSTGMSGLSPPMYRPGVGECARFVKE